MIILGTNVISELMRSTPHPAVRAWMNSQSRDSLLTTAITVMQLRSRVEKLLKSRRRRELEADIDWALSDPIGNRVLSYDREAVFATAKWSGVCRRAGRPRSTSDMQIAGVAISRNIPIATRDVHDFQGISVKLINPWDMPVAA
ncbi:MAG TPA: type II toxin-antitoxin system VapC family toxin [Hyphomicrobiaceae bacterium]|nr:type II toxin-antitoxin system VapC family toxin [Hyphomicrobiaceae bacterium]